MYNITSGLIWKFMEKIAAQAVSFVVSIILARLLEPEQFGLIAEVMVFISIANVFVTTGLSGSLIQNKDSDELDFSSVFYTNIALSIAVYIVLYFTAPLIGAFFNEVTLPCILRVLGVKLFFSAYASIQQAYISKHMMFKKGAVCVFLSTVISAIIGVLMAYNGYGVWALVSQQLIFSLFQIVISRIILRWHPNWKFSWMRAKRMLGFGNAILAAGIIDSITGQLRTIFVGKFYTETDLAYYNRGDTYPQILMSSINNSMHTVLFAAYSQKQNDYKAVKEIMRNAIKKGSYFVFVGLALLAIAAKSLIYIMLTEKWLPCVPYLQIACIGYATWILQIAEQESIMGLGYGYSYLRVTLIRSLFNIVGLTIFARQGVLFLSWVTVAASFFSWFLVADWVRKHLGYSVKEQVKDLIPAVIVAVAIIISGGLSLCIDANVYLQLIIQVAVGLIVCILMSIAFNIETFYWICGKASCILLKKEWKG